MQQITVLVDFETGAIFGAGGTLEEAQAEADRRAGDGARDWEPTTRREWIMSESGHVYAEVSVPEGREWSRHDGEAALEQGEVRGYWMAAEADDLLAVAAPRRFMDMKPPSWTDLLPILLASYENGGKGGRAASIENLLKMADLADRYVSAVQEGRIRET
ncbi:hypothetical protein [Tianweitania sediminis]|uniref:Uncharacterized protein n=1 Tax=Tianweitania sediminis TaxID=1502156 RepID=A0A8J7RQQ8_9HYPH|nr:hypothetical protein [Tianweitania sediminis]MBP0441426.1 hypothetical protein [Tianweitania sediminis]